MAMDAEERRKQRQEKEKARKAAYTRQLRFLAVGGVVILCLAAVLLITVLKRNHTAAPKPTRPTAAETTAATEPPSTVIHLAFGGDLNVTEQTLASGGDTQDYTETFMDVVPLLANADLTVLNVDGSVSSMPASMLRALAGAGVDMIQLANSYSISDGVLGLASAIDGVRSAGMEPLGVYKNDQEYRAGKGYTIREVNGVKIAFVAFTKGMDGMTLPSGSRNCVNILYKDYDSTYQTVDTERISAVLDAVAGENPDFTVALLHWGSEFNNTISDSQEKIRKLMTEKGVDAIVGTHSHYVQQMVTDEETGTFTAYCLGDFFGNAERSGSEYSVVLDLEITKTQEKTEITDYSYTPIFTVNEEEKPLKLVRIEPAIHAYETDYNGKVSQPIYEAMQNALERIEKRIHPETEE